MTDTDFTFFWHGSTLLVISATLFRSLIKTGAYRKRFYITFFCFLLGISEWTAVFSTAGSPESVFSSLRVILFFVAFLFILGSLSGYSPGIRRMLPVYVVGIAALAALWFAGINLLLAVQYIVAFPSLVAFSVVVIRGRKNTDKPVRYGSGMPVVFLCVYTLLWLIPSPDCVLPGFMQGKHVINIITSAGTMVRACCMTGALLSIYTVRYKLISGPGRASSMWCLPVIYILLVILSLPLAGYMEHVTQKHMREDLLEAVRSISAAMNPVRVKQLKFTSEDSNNPAFIRIREQVKAWGKYTGLNSIYTMSMRNCMFFSGPENIDKGSPHASPPGTEYLNPDRGFIDAWSSGESGVTGPYTDEYGTFVSGYAPVFDRFTGKILMIVAVDHDADIWLRTIHRGRDRAFGLSMLLVACLVFWYLIFDKRGSTPVEKRGFFFNYLESFCCLVTGIVLASVISVSLDYFEIQKQKRELDALTDSWANIIRSIIRDTQSYAEDIAVYIKNSREITFKEFEGFCNGKLVAPNVSISWYPAVPAGDRYSFEAWMRRQGFRDYRIFRQRDNSTREYNLQGDVYYPLAYNVPRDYGNGMPGNDISCNSNIRSVIMTGLHEFFTSDYESVLSGDGRIMLMSPVYKHEKSAGIVVSNIDFNRLLDRVISFRNSVNLGIRITVIDIAQDGGYRPVASYPPADNDRQNISGAGNFFSVYPVFFSGHTFGIIINPTGHFYTVNTKTAGPVSFVCGLFISVAVSLLAGYLAFRERNLESEIEKRTGELSESRERYSIISDITGQLIYRWDVATGELQWNGLIEEITGFTPEAFSSVDIDEWRDLIHPDDRDSVSEILENCVEARENFYCEYRMRKFDGEYINVEDSGTFLTDSSGRLVYLLGAVKDITKRKQAEKELRESEERFRLLYEASFGGIAVHDRGRILENNHGLSEMTGYTMEELDGMDGMRLVSPEWRSLVMERIDADFKGCYDADGIRKDGTVYPLEIRAKVIPYHGRQVRVTEFRDITNRKAIEYILEKQKQELEASYEELQEQMEEFETMNAELLEANSLLAESEKKFSTAFRINPSMMIISTIDSGMFIDVNDIFLSTLGYVREQVIGKTSAEIGLFLDYTQREIAVSSVVTKGAIKNAELMIRSSSGEVHYGLFSADVIRFKDTNYLLSVINDITDRKRFEFALSESEKKYRMLFESSLDAIVILEGEVIADCNDMAFKMFRCGREEIIGSHPASWVPEKQPGGGDSLAVITGREGEAYRDYHRPFYYVFRVKDGTEIETEVSLGRFEFGGKSYLFSIIRDISERRRYEARLNHMQKMDAIGQLAGGIAHDFNNQLSGIMGYAELLSMKLRDDGLKKYADGIISVASRSADMTRKLLVFSRKREFQAVRCDLHSIIRETVEILEHSIDKRITVTCDFTADEFVVKGDPAALQNTFLNLGLNARDAMENGGTLSFETGVVSIDRDDYTHTVMSIEPGRYIRVAVSDTGVGMNDEVKSHLFEPFFTTKMEDKGTGMGLASVYATVKSHGGSISVYSETGRGTVFRIFLPLTYHDEGITEDAGVNEMGVPTGNILIVDDEEIIREILSEILHGDGHMVTAASDGKDAIEIYRQKWRSIDLVILDMVMPGLNGIDTFIAMKSINPEVKVILTSGFAISDESEKLFQEGVRGFVHKPFQRNELIKEIARVIKS